MNIGVEQELDLRNRNATDLVRRHSDIWAVVDTLSGCVGAQPAYQFVLRMILLRIIEPTGDARSPWDLFAAEALEPEDEEASIDTVLEAALRKWVGESTAETEAWEMRDFIMNPTVETTAALHAMVLAVAALRGDAVEVFDLVLERYSRAEGDGGDYFTPRSLVSLVVSLLDPRPGERVFDPACGSAGFLVAAADHARRAETGGEDGALVGRDVNRGAWQIGRMNLLAHGLRGDLGAGPINAFLGGIRGEEGHCDVVMLNPPFGQKDWASDTEIKTRDWPFGRPARSNANFAWLQAAFSSLRAGGRAGVLMPATSTRDSRLAAREITANLVKGDVIDALVTLPDGLFPHLRVSPCLWILSHGKGTVRGSGERDRHGQFLFVDARNMGEQVTRGQRILPDSAIAQIAEVVRTWRSPDWGSFVPDQHGAGHGWWATATRADIEAREFDLTPERYVPSGQHQEGTDQQRDNDEEIRELTWRLLRRTERVQELDGRLREVLSQW